MCNTVPLFVLIHSASPLITFWQMQQTGTDIFLLLFIFPLSCSWLPADPKDPVSGGLSADRNDIVPSGTGPALRSHPIPLTARMVLLCCSASRSHCIRHNLAFVPLWLSSIKGDEVHTVAILDATGKYAPLFEDTESYRFINGDKDMDKYRQMSEKEIFAFLNISDDLQKNPKNATLYSKKQIPADLSRLVNMTLKKQIESDKLATFNIPKSTRDHKRK